MKFILGKKIEMTQVYNEDGAVVPVTVIEAGPCIVTQVKTKEKDNYSSVQVGFGLKKKVTKPIAGHLKKTVKEGKDYPRYLQEFRVEEGKYKVGDYIGVDVFNKNDLVQVSGTSKGKGFAGVVKRHGFKGGPASHGHKDQLRMPGSIGATEPGRVFKGKRMAGRLGGQGVTVKNLEVVDIDAEKNLLYIKGAVPGVRNSLVVISGEGEMDVKNILEEPAKPAKPEEEKITKDIEGNQEEGSKQEPDSDAETAEKKTEETLQIAEKKEVALTNEESAEPKDNEVEKPEESKPEEKTSGESIIQ